MKFIYCFLGVFVFGQLSAQVYKKSEPFAHTYSIVARDAETGEMGVAVQSHWFSVGSLVTYGKAGVGVVASQAFVNPSYGPKGLALMTQGLNAKQALQALIENDEGEQFRQVAFLDAKGTVATHTGSACIDMAGHRQGENFSVQANMMLNNTVWDAMANAFETTKGTLTERMLAALQAAETEQGDIRGKQSAAILVVKGTATGNSWEDTVVDLRVEDHESPIEELGRLLKIHKAYEFMNQGDLAMEKGDSKQAENLYLQAQQLFPNNIEMKYWYAINLVTNNDFKHARPILERVFKAEPNWKILTSRLVKCKMLDISDAELKEILSW